jgi:integrase
MTAVRADATMSPGITMRGTIYKRVHVKRDGRRSVLYYGVVSSTDPETKKRHQDWGKGHPTKRDAAWDLRRRLDAQAVRAGLSPTTLKLGPYLWDQWLPSMVDRIEATTYAGYERAVRHATRHLGEIRLQSVTAGHLNQLYAELRASGGRYQDPKRAHETKPLAPGTVRAVHAVLSKALSEAVELGLLAANPATRAKPPRVGANPSIESWTAEELHQFLDFVRDDPVSAVWRLAASTGMRRGELVGLRWEDVELDRAALVVRQTRTMANRTVVTTTPKNGQPRVIDLDADTVEALAQLRAESEPSDHDLVVRAPGGSPLHPDRLSELFCRLVRDSGLRPIRLHDLRHTHASLLLKAGVPLKVVSERLGHADPAFTMRVYQHVMPGMQAAAARTFAEFVHAASADVGRRSSVNRGEAGSRVNPRVNRTGTEGPGRRWM